MRTVAPRSSSRSACSQERKSATWRCRTYMYLCGRARAGGRPGPVYRVPAELVAQRGDRLHGRRILLPGSEPGVERVEDRHRVLDVLGRTADHQPVAVLQTPHPTGHTAVEVADVALGKQFRVHHVVAEPGVAAVDHHVAGGERLGKLGDGGPGRVPG